MTIIAPISKVHFGLSIAISEIIRCVTISLISEWHFLLVVRKSKLDWLPSKLKKV
jgi:hypothetical protein